MPTSNKQPTYWRCYGTGEVLDPVETSLTGHDHLKSCDGCEDCSPPKTPRKEAP